MSDSLFKEDEDAVAEGENMASSFEWEVSKHSIGISESPVSATQEPAKTNGYDTTASISSEEEEEGATALTESEEDLRSEKGFYSKVEKQTEVEICIIPTSPPVQTHEQEEACDVETKPSSRELLRKQNENCHSLNFDNEFPALIRCFQVVNVHSKHLSLQFPLLHFLELIPKHCSKHMLLIHEEGLCYRWSEMIPQPNHIT